jgi:hypothetical protein
MAKIMMAAAHVVEFEPGPLQRPAAAVLRPGERSRRFDSDSHTFLHCLTDGFRVVQRNRR